MSASWSQMLLVLSSIATACFVGWQSYLLRSSLEIAATQNVGRASIDSCADTLVALEFAASQAKHLSSMIDVESGTIRDRESFELEFDELLSLQKDISREYLKLRLLMPGMVEERALHLSESFIEKEQIREARDGETMSVLIYQARQGYQELVQDLFRLCRMLNVGQTV